MFNQVVQHQQSVQYIDQNIQNISKVNYENNNEP